MAKEEYFKIFINVQDNDLNKGVKTAKKLTDAMKNVNRSRLKIKDQVSKNVASERSADAQITRNKFFAASKINTWVNNATRKMWEYGNAQLEIQAERDHSRVQLEAALKAHSWKKKETAELMKQNDVVQKRGLMTQAQLEKAEQNLATFGADKKNMLGLAEAAATLDAHAHNGKTSIMGTKQAVDQLMKAIKSGSTGGLVKSGTLNKADVEVFKSVGKMKEAEVIAANKVLTDKQKEKKLVELIATNYGKLEKNLSKSDIKKNINAERQKKMSEDAAIFVKKINAFKSSALSNLGDFVAKHPTLTVSILAIATAIATLSKAVMAYETIKATKDMFLGKGKDGKKGTWKGASTVRKIGTTVGGASILGGTAYLGKALLDIEKEADKAIKNESVTDPVKKAGGGAINQANMYNRGDGFIANEAWLNKHEQNKGKTVIIQMNDKVIFDSFKQEANKKYVRNVYRK